MARACIHATRALIIVEFNDATYGETRGMIVAAPETYGVNKLWLVLEPIGIDVGGSSGSSPSEHEDSAGEDASGAGPSAGASGAGPS